MKTKWNSPNEMKNLNKKRRKIRLVFLGILILVIVLLFSGCVKTEIKYVETPREPIVCYKYIKTALDMAKCLEEYKIKWK